MSDTTRVTITVRMDPATNRLIHEAYYVAYPGNRPSFNAWLIDMIEGGIEAKQQEQEQSA